MINAHIRVNQQRTLFVIFTFFFRHPGQSLGPNLGPGLDPVRDRLPGIGIFFSLNIGCNYKFGGI